MDKVKYFDELFACKEGRGVIWKSWVQENGLWGFRELTPAEIKIVRELEKNNRTFTKT